MSLCYQSACLALGIAMSVAVASCPGDDARKGAVGAQRAQRVVSLDYCADQYVLKFVDPENIVALSPDAEEPFSYLREEARGLRKIRPVAENILALSPDVVVRSYGGGPSIEHFLKRAGITVVNIGWAAKLDGSDETSIPVITQRVATALGEKERGRQTVANYRGRLSNINLRRIEGSQDKAPTLYMSAAGATTGPGSLVHELLIAAGLENFEDQPGWRPIPLEKLAYKSPSMVATAFFYNGANHRNSWSASRHPVARSLRTSTSHVELEGALTACGAWFAAYAAEALAGALQ